MVERRQRWRRGRRAEAWAVLWSRLKGYRILPHNFLVQVGETDAIAWRGTPDACMEKKDLSGHSYLKSDPVIHLVHNIHVILNYS